MPDRETAHALDDLEDLLKRIPGASKFVKEVRDLRALLVDRRPPRIAVLGRRGSGKSSLANALLGEEVAAVGAVEDTTRAAGWYDVATGRHALRWLDTPGLRAGAEPERRAEVERALREEAPDVVLVLVKATQVDAGIDEDLAEVKALLDALKDRPAPRRIVGVVSRVDELAPARVKAPPYDADPVKRQNIQDAVALLEGHFKRASIEVAAVVPVAAYQRFKDGARVVDWRWNLEALADSIFEGLPRDAQVEAARAIERAQSLRRRLAKGIVETATSVSVVVGATPLPVADLAVLLPLQSLMLTSVVYVSGRPLGPRAVAEWVGSLGLNVAAGFGLREAVRAIVKLIPGLGATVSGAVAATGTWALGKAAIRYFIDGVSVEESRRAFEDAVKEGAPDDPHEGGGEGPK